MSQPMGQRYWVLTRVDSVMTRLHMLGVGGVTGRWRRGRVDAP